MFFASSDRLTLAHTTKNVKKQISFNNLCGCKQMDAALSSDAETILVEEHDGAQHVGGQI